MLQPDILRKMDCHLARVALFSLGMWSKLKAGNAIKYYLLDHDDMRVVSRLALHHHSLCEKRTATRVGPLQNFRPCWFQSSQAAATLNPAEVGVT